MPLATVVRADLVRYGARLHPRSFLTTYLRSPGFRCIFWHRVTAELHGGSGSRRVLYLLARVAQVRSERRFGITLPPTATIGAGLFIGHWGGIIVNESATIGVDCNLGHEVTIGKGHRGARAGVPHIGDRVFLGPGSRIIGAVRVGDDAVIGVNAVVVDDVEPKAVVAAPASSVVSHAGSEGLVNRRSS